jgi:hypothetical protein
VIKETLQTPDKEEEQWFLFVEVVWATPSYMLRHGNLTAVAIPQILKRYIRDPKN